MLQNKHNTPTTQTTHTPHY